AVSFFFQAEDGIRDFHVTGVQTCALPILLIGWRLVPNRQVGNAASFETGTYFTEARVVKGGKAIGQSIREVEQSLEEADAQIVRSEERRVGKECRAGWARGRWSGQRYVGQ